MVPRWRFELQTLWLKVKCSTDWANGAKLIGCLGKIRTYECHSQSVVPYRLATRQYVTQSGGRRWIWTIEPEGTDLQSAAFGHFAILPNSGAESRTWTHNLLITSQLLYQLSYSGLKWWAMRDSNSRPSACKADALTNWANRPLSDWTCTILLYKMGLVNNKKNFILINFNFWQIDLFIANFSYFFFNPNI